jgi:methylglutamate dehydrogenase subunit D
MIPKENACVPETALASPVARSAFHGLLKPGRHGRAEGPAGVVVQERTGLAALHLAAFRARSAAVTEAVHRVTGLSLPASPQRVSAGELAGALAGELAGDLADGLAGASGLACASDLVALWSGPEQWTLLAPESAAADLEDRLVGALAGMAAVTAVGDGRAVLSVSGPRAHDALAKGIGLDLAPPRFGAGATAMTMASGIDVQLSRLPESDAFELILFPSFAGSFWHWLAESSAEYGLVVLPPA